jgi:hypothetical protein
MNMVNLHNRDHVGNVVLVIRHHVDIERRDDEYVMIASRKMN